MLGWLWSVVGSMWDIIGPFIGRSKKTTVLLLGLDDAGKSTLLYLLKEDKITQPAPTAYPTSESFSLGNLTFRAFDLGGHKQFRRLWKEYFHVADAIVYVVDSVRTKRLEESRTELNRLLADPDLTNVPIVILLNKIDLPNTMGVEEAIDYFSLRDVVANTLNTKTFAHQYPRHNDPHTQHVVKMFDCSLIQHHGYGAAFRWLAAQLK